LRSSHRFVLGAASMHLPRWPVAFGRALAASAAARHPVARARHAPASWRAVSVRRAGAQDRPHLLAGWVSVHGRVVCLPAKGRGLGRSLSAVGGGANNLGNRSGAGSARGRGGGWGAGGQHSWSGWAREAPWLLVVPAGVALLLANREKANCAQMSPVGEFWIRAS